MTSDTNTTYPKPTIVRMVALVCLFFVAWRASHHLLPYQLSAPPIYHVGYDFGYWLFMALRLDELLIISRTGSFYFTLYIFVSLILLLIFPKSRLLAIANAIIFFLRQRKAIPAVVGGCQVFCLLCFFQRFCVEVRLWGSVPMACRGAVRETKPCGLPVSLSRYCYGAFLLLGLPASVLCKPWA